MAQLADAEIVVIGGGVIGCGIAYYLPKLGKRDVLVLEKSGLTHGSTWHAAGLVSQLRTSRNLTRMLQMSVELYAGLEAETGQATGWKPVGTLRVASSRERWLEFKRIATAAKSFGLETELLSAKEAQELFPIMTTDGVVGAAFTPSDGYIDSSGVTQAFAKGARMGGARIHEGVRVTDLVVEGPRVTRVVTDHGTIRADVVVNAAGMWAPQIGAMAGVKVPAATVEHQYVMTERVPGLPPRLPTMRDPDRLIYVRDEVGGILLGGFEPETVPFGENGIPSDFGRQLLPFNFERFERLAVPAAERMPVLNEVGMREFINGPIPVSPDGEPVMGQAMELENLFIACGFSLGVAAAGGAGRIMAEWIVEGRPSIDLWPFDLRRFGEHHTSRRYLAARGVESYTRYYVIHYPGEELKTGRGGRRSPLHQVLKEKGAVYGSKFGWERPNWFAPEGTDAVERPSFERPNWFEAVGEEHRAVRERVGLADVTSFAKAELEGPRAFACLQRIAANDLDKPPGSVTYTQLCNERGGIEADLTISRLAKDRFYVVTGSGFGVHDFGWIRAHLPEAGGASLRDVTSSKAVINLCGPFSRELLEKVTDEDVSHEGFPFLGCRELRIGYAPVLALRITYVGELGWELHIPTEYALHVYELLWRAGQEFGVANVGYRALDSLRMEKRYLYWSADISPDYNPYEAGLGFCVALEKGDFIGREALTRVKEEGARRRLCCFTLERPAEVFGGETMLREGKVLGTTTSGNYGYTVGASIVLGYLPSEEAGHARYEIEVFGEAIPALRHDRALYDPERERILA